MYMVLLLFLHNTQINNDLCSLIITFNIKQCTVI